MDVIDEYNKDRFNPIIHDFIKKLPGVTSRNVYAILNRVESMTQLLAMSVDDLSEMVGKNRQVWASFSNAVVRLTVFVVETNFLLVSITPSQAFLTGCFRALH